MKKSLIALAVAGAFAVPAHAVELNGGIAVGVEVIAKRSDGVTPGSGVSTMGMNSGYTNLSLAHSEDLSNGMKMDVFIQIEDKINHASQAPGNAGGTLVNRNSYIGLSGGFGAIRLGTNENAYERMLWSHNYLDGDWSYGNIAIMGVAGANTGGVGTTIWNRTSDTIMYFSPDLNGLNFELDYVTPSTGKTPGAAGVSPTIMSAAVEYAPADGPFRIYGALQNSNDQWGGANDKESNMLIGGGMNFGDIKIDLMFERQKQDPTGANEFKHSAIDVEAKFGLPTGHIGLSVVKAGKTKNAGADIANSGATSIAAGYWHTLAKNSSMFFIVSKVSNQDAANYNLAVFQGGGAAALGADYSNLVVGLKHTF